MPETSSDRRKIYRVSELTRLVKVAIERQVGAVWVEGELSNVRRPASGHLYFTIKDDQSQIAAVLFRGNQRGLRFEPRDGTLVRAFGEVTVYERGGNYQILVKSMEEGGLGSLQARFEALKAKLNEEGLFAPERKRALPLLPRRVGVVTSRTGAAVRDILNVVHRRFPGLHVILAPAKVQGEGAAAEVAAAIDALNRYGGFDALIVGRGGGSLEDLWCFNEEVVARAIVRSPVPVISAVGHEIDFTIADFVADVRAPTPSAAAELVVGCKEDFDRHLDERYRTMVRLVHDGCFRYRARLDRARNSYVFREPRNLVRQFQQRLDAANMRMVHVLNARCRQGRERLERVELRLEHGLRMCVGQGRQRLAEARGRMANRMELRLLAARERTRACERQLRALSPLAVLERGYSLTRDAAGKIVTSVSSAAPGDRLETRVRDGVIRSTVD